MDRTPEAAVRMMTLGLLDEAVAASRRLGDEQDGEALHDFRVALRRLRTLVKAYHLALEDSLSKKQRRSLRDVAQSTGAARDTEVQLSWLRNQSGELRDADRAAWAWLVDKLETRRLETYQEVRGDLVKQFQELEPKLRRNLSRYVTELDETTGRSFAATAGELIAAAGDALVADLEAVKSPNDVEGAHQARIKAKRLRYLLEPLRKTAVGDASAALVKAMKTLQETLGDLHDGHVLAGEVASALVETATARARRLHEALYVPGGSAIARSEKDLRSGLLSLDRRVRDRVEGLFRRLETEWLQGGLTVFHGRLTELAVELAARGKSQLEIERKYLLRSFPALGPEVKALEVNQGWIPGRTIRERLRRVDSADGPRFFRTIKMGKGIQRVELEDEMPADVFDKLWPLTDGHRVRKRRYKVPVGERTWEIDQFLDRDLLLAEIELQSRDEAVDVPDWLQPHLVREVTGEAEYVNENLAK